MKRDWSPLSFENDQRRLIYAQVVSKNPFPFLGEHEEVKCMLEENLLCHFYSFIFLFPQAYSSSMNFHLLRALLQNHFPLQVSHFPASLRFHPQPMNKIIKLAYNAELPCTFPFTK